MGLLSFLFGACSKQPSTQRLAQADRIVATNIQFASSLTITGDEVGRVSRAVASANPDSNTYGGYWDWNVQFYQGTNCVAAIDLMDRTFWSAGKQYTDGTGVLEAFYKRLSEEAERLEKAKGRQ
jgi:hypothetical protein